MKAKPYQVSSLIPQIQNGFKGALVFGPDSGVVQEISEKIASFVVTNIKDELNVIKITPQKIKEIPSILSDEGNASALFGGRKLLWVKEGDNSILDAVEAYPEQIKTNAFLLITAGNLTKNSGVRTFCEAHPDILTVACYADTPRDIADLVKAYFSQAGIRLEESALNLLIERLGENRGITKKELEKLITYIGNKKTVEVTDVQAVVTDTRDSSVDLFCCGIAAGDPKTAEKEYHLLLANGENPVSIIRILYQYFNRLLDAITVMDREGAEAGLKKIMKPAQFRLESSFKKQLMIWKKQHIFKVLNLLTETEKQLKSTGYPAETLLGRTILQITQVAVRQKM